MEGSISCCEIEQAINSVECSELTGTVTTPTITLKNKILDDDVSVIGTNRSETTSIIL